MLDYMSGGRFFLGVGPGWNEPEFTSMGVAMRQTRSAYRVRSSTPSNCYSPSNNVSFQGAFFQFNNVTIEPRPEKYFTIWVAGWLAPSRRAVARQTLHGQTVLQRIARPADAFTCRASGNAAWVVRDFALTGKRLSTGLLDVTPARWAWRTSRLATSSTRRDRHKALAVQRQPMATIMGTHRSWEHGGCYLVGSIDDIVERLKFLESHGLEHVTIQPAGPRKWRSSTCGWTRLFNPHFRSSV